MVIFIDMNVLNLVRLILLRIFVLFFSSVMIVEGVVFVVFFMMSSYLMIVFGW